MGEKNETAVDEKKEQKYGRKADFIQIMLCVICNSSVLSSGMTLGFTSIALPFMEEPNAVLNVTSSESSWIASIAAISTPFGCLLSGPIIDSLGRKTGLLVLNVPAVMGWLLIAFRPTLVKVYIGRLLTGVACGLSSIPATVYMAESSTSSLRGFLVTGTSIAISLGVATVYSLGLVFQENWQMVAYLCALCPVMACVLTALVVPESPLWLLNHGKGERARKALMTLRGANNPEQVQQEFDTLSQQVRRNRSKPSTLNAIKSLNRPESYKPLLIMNGFFLFQQLTGVFVVIFYAVSVVQEAGVTSDSYVVAVLIGLARLVFTVIAAWMSRRFGRRPTALISGTGMTLSLMVLATHLLIQHQQQLNTLESVEAAYDQALTNSSTVDDLLDTQTDKPPNFLPVITILVYISSSTIGFLTLPWAMIGEVFPVQIRGLASGFTTSMTYLVSFICVKLYPTMIEYMKKHGVFYFYGVMALYGTVFVYFCLPETQGKTLMEIENYFAGKKTKKVSSDEEEALSGTKMITIVKSQEKKKASENI